MVHNLSLPSITTRSSMKTDQQAFYVETGRRIAKQRRERGVTQEDLALAIGLTRTSVTNIERGRQKLLLHTLADIAAKLDTSLASLLPEGDTPSTESFDKVVKSLPEPERKFVLAGVKAVRPGSPKQ
jgi:transcriptional regulator with XRE-family HTH domain